MNWSILTGGRLMPVPGARRLRSAMASVAVLLAFGGASVGAQNSPGTPGAPARASTNGNANAAGAVQPDVARTWDETVLSFGGSVAQVLPCRDVMMKFAFPTEVAEARVSGGERVKSGDVLVRARDADVVAAIEQQRLIAGSDLEIQGARVQQELANFRFEQLKIGKVFTPEDFERAKADAMTTKVQLDQAILNLASQQSRLKQLEGQFERYSLNAPFDGIIEQVMVDEGKGVSETTDVLRLVNTEQLWLDAYPPTDDTLRLNLDKGSQAWVLVNLPAKPALVKGRVLYVSPAADYVGQTRRVRVEIDNPKDWPAGLQGCVRFTPPSQEWMDNLIEGGRDGTDGSQMRSSADVDADGAVGAVESTDVIGAGTVKVSGAETASLVGDQTR